jgi:hypothetical protein
MVSMLASSAVDCVFEPRSGQAKDYKIGICCFSAKHAALKEKNQRLVGSYLECVSECCLTPTQQFFSYIMARTS